MTELRWYQSESLDAILDYLRYKVGNPCVVLPTGAGKTRVIAKLATDCVQRWQGRIMVVSHVKELVQQAADDLQKLCPSIPVGIYSAGLKRRDMQHDIIVAGVQSAYSKAEEFGRIDLLIVDEAHLIPESGEGQYRTLINGLVEQNPDIRVLGLTATPYRTGSGSLCGPDKILNEIIYEAPIKPLIEQGYLCKIVGKAGLSQVDTSNVKITGDDYDTKQIVEAYEGMLDAAIPEIVANTIERKSILVFTQSIEQAQRVAKVLRDYGQDVGEVYGHTISDERTHAIKDFKAGRLRWMVNVNVLTTGFDATNIDCVVLLRSTISPGLYYQMVGRGLRINSLLKSDCLILDYGTNIERHGPIDTMTTEIGERGQAKENRGKICPLCRNVVNTSVKVCPCGHVWETKEREDKTSKLSQYEPLADAPKINRYAVQGVTYRIHRKKGGDENTPKTLRVTYQCGLSTFVSEWICLEHEGFVRRRAVAWWHGRSVFPPPVDVAEGYLMAGHGVLAVPMEIDVESKPGEKFPRVVNYILDTKPETVTACKACGGRERELHQIFDHPKYGGAVVCGTCLHTFDTLTLDDWAACTVIDRTRHDYEVEYFGIVPMYANQIYAQSAVDDANEESPF